MRPIDITAIGAFSDEMRASVPAVLAALDAAERDRADAGAVQEAFRLIHALKGAASMVGLAALGSLLNRAEALLDHAVSVGQPLDDDLIQLLRAVAPKFAEYLDRFLAGLPVGEIAGVLAAALAAPEADAVAIDEPPLDALLEMERQSFVDQIAALPVPDLRGPACTEAAVPDLPGPASTIADVDLDLGPSEAIPAELAEVFAQEAQEHLQTIARLTRHLAGSPDDRESLQELRRAVHTIKGAAGIVGYKAAARLAHRMEDFLDSWYDGTAALTPEAVRLLSTSYDALDDLIGGALDADGARRTLGALFAQFDTMAVAPAMTPAPADASVPDGRDRAAADAPAAERRRAGVDRRRNPEDRRTGGAQVVRVPFQRLGELLRLVSELVVNRSTFDEHYASLIRQVEEVKLSTHRLRRVAVKLETGYEVRALAGHLPSVDEAPQAHGFDELEFDRYTDFHLLSRELTETTTDINTISSRLTETIGDFDGDLTRLGRLTREIQDKVMEFRMVPLATLATRLERAVRVTGEECGREVALVIEGEQVALDKTLLEAMADPLMHLLRNAVDHGIEPPAERVAAGKPRRGRIAVRASHEGTDVLLEVEDDGRGLDAARIRRVAVERGYMGESEAAAMSGDDLSALVFQPGFSTADRVSEVSGRGVGMDIVKAKVARLGGRIRLQSTPGAGTTVTIRVPMTLAITRILLIRAGGQLFGLPLGAVMQIVRPEPSAITVVGTEKVIETSGRTYPLRDLAGILELPRAAETTAAQPVLIANLGGRHLALAVDEIVQSRDAVIKTLGSHLRRVPGMWGATLLGDGTVILILNPADLAGGAEEARVLKPAATRVAASESRPYSILIVDDSLSMRHVLSGAVKKAGWSPVQARDGVEALELVTRAAELPDLILLDIEMPRMDGYEFLATVRAQPAMASLPIVMLTSRGGDKHRERAMSLGATGYLVKPFQEEALLQHIDRLVRAARGRVEAAAS